MRVGQVLVLPYVMAGLSSANELGVWSRSVESENTVHPIDLGELITAIASAERSSDGLSG